MKKLCTFTLAILTAGALALPLRVATAAAPGESPSKPAASPPSGTPAGKETKKETKEAKATKLPFKGKIASVDKENKTITIESKKGEGRTYSVPESAKLMKAGGGTATWDDLTAGQVVSGSYEKAADGTMTAISLTVGAKAEKEKPAGKGGGEAKPEKAASEKPAKKP